MACTSNFADANIAMVAGATITLCENTVFPVGSPLDSTYTTFAGGIPLVVDVNDVTIQCGTSGASGGNCVLEGGFVQLFLGTPDNNLSTVNNLLVKGLTFTGDLESASSEAPAAVQATSAGNNVVFDDCLFTNMKTTGYVFDLKPQVGMDLTIQNSVFSNVSFSYDAIYGDANTDVKFDTVSFTDMGHLLPQDNVERCANVTAADCSYTSSYIHLLRSQPDNDANANVDIQDKFKNVVVSNSAFYTAILQTLDEWGFGTTKQYATLIEATTNITIYNEANRTANDDFCEGAYAAGYNSSTGIDWSCKRIDYTLSVDEILRCGINCDANGNFSTLLEVLNITGLSTLPSNDITLFAPTNAAFENLPGGFLDNLKENDNETLRELLQYHITSEDAVLIEAIEIGFPAALTLQGESVSFTPSDTANNILYSKVDEAIIIHEDWEESPGAGKVVHVIDSLVNPSTIPIYPSFDTLFDRLNLTAFKNAASRVSFTPALDDDTLYTFFIPSNEAFASSASASALLAGTDDAPITELLNHHIVVGNYSVANLVNTSQPCFSINSLASKNIKITYDGSTLKWNDAITNTSQVDNVAWNGILHVIDGVFDPANILLCGTPSASGFVSLSFSFAVGLVGTILAMLV